MRSAGFLFSAALLLIAGCRTADEKLAACLDRDLFWEGRGTQRQLMTDRIISGETETWKRDLFSGDRKKQDEARENLKRLFELIEFGKNWRVPEYELSPAFAAKAPVIDGRISKEEWKKTVEIPGSCRAGRKRRNFDGSRLLFKYDKNMLYIAAYVPLPDTENGERRISPDDHLLIYFDTPGGTAPRYTEFVLFPEKGQPQISLWTYCGNGSSEKLADIADSGIIAATAETKYGYTVEAAIPRTLLRTDRRGCCRIGLLRWDTALQDYRTPAAIPYHGHDIFNRINLRLQ